MKGNLEMCTRFVKANKNFRSNATFTVSKRHFALDLLCRIYFVWELIEFENERKASFLLAFFQFDGLRRRTQNQLFKRWPCPKSWIPSCICCVLQCTVLTSSETSTLVISTVRAEDIYRSDIIFNVSWFSSSIKFIQKILVEEISGTIHINFAFYAKLTIQANILVQSVMKTLPLDLNLRLEHG